MNDNRPGTLMQAIGAAMFIVSAVFISAYFFAPEWLFWKLVTALPFVFVLIAAAPYGAISLSDLINWKDNRALVNERRNIELARLKLEHARLRDEPLEARVAEVVDNESERGRLSNWRTYWITVMQYSLSHDSVVAWRNGLQALLTYPDWRDSIVLPFIRKNWLTPIYQGSKTKLADGVTVAHILNELSAGRCPPAPYGEPPVLQPQEFQHNETQANTSENSYEGVRT